jgi:hypothetical protein
VTSVVVSSKSFDGRGNYSIGLKEQIVFPEIEFDKIDRIRGLDITVTTTARTDDEGRALAACIRLPVQVRGRCMAKKGMINRELKREKTVAKYADKA